jgi:hypothetical protein
MTDLRPEALLTDARAATGLDDYGADGYRDGLAALCESLNRDAQLNELGDVALPGMLVGSLANRLKVVDWIANHPEVADERIERPIVVIGMFRAGTTLLSRLFDQDSRNRALLMWEAGDSVPPPTPDNHRSGPRVDAVHASTATLAQINPMIEVVHHEQADQATECITVMGQDFKSLTYEAIANVPGYHRWLMSVDQRSAYDYHRSVLQVLQSGGVRGRWTLKSPHHAIALEHLTALYPDARLVLLHRDPVVLTASVCSLISTLSSTFSDADHRGYIAEHWPAMLDESIRRIDAFRDAHPERSIVDVHYADLVTDPAGTVAAIYEACGDSLDEIGAKAISAYVDAHPKGQFGTHTYDVAEFGLDADELAERFRGYTEHYGVRREAVR